MEAINGIPEIEITEEGELIAQELLLHAALPPRASVDALHIAMAAIGGTDYLLAWNCAHIANPAFRNAIAAECLSELGGQRDGPAAVDRD